jgi:glycosyltransferase involved in cell wall biosynthesis
MSITRQKILLFSTIRTSFIEDDRRLLERIGDVKWIRSRGILAIGRLKLAMGFRKVGIAWFASSYSAVMVFFARLFRKKSVIIIGGADVISDPGLGYGLMLSAWKRPFVRYAIRNATNVLPTSHYLKEAAQQLCESANLEVCPPGLDHQFWKPDENRENAVLTVAHCDTTQRISIKGIDLVLEVAEQMREFSFRIVGVTPSILSELNASVPGNVQIVAPLERDQLLPEYQQASVYLQLSRIESCGIATAEAMLCGCIPVVSDTGGLPETVGSTGSIVPSEDVRAAVTAVQTVLQGDSNLSGETCRQWAASRFSIQQREERFRELLLG